MNGVHPSDDLYQFLLDALRNDNLLNAINYAADCGISIAELSKTSRKLYDRILADNGIDIEALTAELGTSVSI